MGQPNPPFATAPRRRSLLGLFLGLALLGLLGLAGLAGLVSLVRLTTHAGGRLTGEQIAVIDVAGVITATAESSLLGGMAGAGAEQLVGFIRDAAGDEAVRAVIVRINSPGGSAAASQEIFEALLAARQSSRKPFIASLADVAASGGYYVAAGCERIVANRATMTGSIGVIMNGYDWSGLLDWAHVKPQTIKSGPYKDIGSADRPMSAAERRLLQTMVDGVYRQFLADVARGRGLKIEQVKPVADGRILTGEQARKAGLVDELGGFWDAVEVARRLASLPAGEPNLTYYGRTTLFEQLFQTRSATPPTLAGGRPAGALTPLWFLAPATAPRLGGG